VKIQQILTFTHPPISPFFLYRSKLFVEFRQEYPTSPNNKEVLIDFLVLYFMQQLLLTYHGSTFNFQSKGAFWPCLCVPTPIITTVTVTTCLLTLLYLKR
jgi:hypothetical protein